MRPSSRPLARWFAVGLTTAASAWVGSSAMAATPVLGNSSYTYQTPQGEQFFAVALRASDLSIAVQPANRHVILLDTSASQSGEYRERGLAALRSLLKTLPEEATVSVYALDVATEPMTDGFVAPADAATQVKAAIANRAPLGATDLAKGLQQALAAFGEQPTGSVVYIGDGMSAANLLRKNELGPLVETLRTRHIPVHAYAVGPDTDWRLLGVLAHQTGGLVKRDIADASPENLGSVLATAAAQPVVYPETIGVSESSDLILGKSPPPLRSDRATILLGRGELPDSIMIGNQGTSRAVAIDAGHVVKDFPAVRMLALAAEQSNGLNMPAAGNELLAAVDGLVTNQVEQLATTGKFAARSNNQAQAELALASLIQADPAAGEAQQLDAVINQPAAEPVDMVAQAAPAAAPPAPANAGLIEAEMQRQRVLTQQLTIETNAAIAQARELRQSAPGDALNLLKRQESQIRASVEIDAEARRQLLRRLENDIVVTANMREKQESEFLLQQERLAELEAQRKVVARMMADEQELEQLISRVRALMYEGYHGDDSAFEQARIVAGHAVNLRPGNGPAMAALFTATAADQLNKTFRLRALSADRFLETLYQVELSAVPFPDEPPIVYPAPEVWWALTERREEYKSVSLDIPSAAELQIREELEKPTRLEYAGIPLRSALENLAQQHRINIVFVEEVIEEEGLSIDENIDLFLNGVTLRSALKLMLEPAGLSYAIEDEVLKITTETAAEEILSLRVYPVADLVIPIVQLGGGALGGGGGMGGMGGGMGGMGGGMGGMGGGMGGMGGGMGGMGMGGGMGGMGMYSVPAVQLPGGPARNGQVVPQSNELAAPIDDAEMQRLLEGVVGEQTSARESNRGIAFASIRDDVAEQTGKKK